MSLLEQNYQNILSVTSISKVLLSDKNIKLSFKSSEENNIISDDSSEEFDNDENNDISEFQNNLSSLNLEDNENDYYLNPVIKDIDLEKFGKEINDELSDK